MIKKTASPMSAGTRMTRSGREKRIPHSIFAIGSWSTSFPRALPKLGAAAEGAGTWVPCLDADLRSRRSFDDPLELREVAGRFVVRPPGRRTLVGATLQLADVRLRLAAYQSCTLGQVELDLEAAHRASFHGPVGHARREPAGVLQDEPHEVRVVAELLHVE